MKFYKRKSEKGASLIEYGMLAGLVSVVAISAVIGVGEEVENTFSTAADGIGVVSDEIEAARAPEPMILEFSAAQATIVPNGGGAITVDWGDPTANTTCGQEFIASGAITCSYPVSGTYQVSIGGSFNQYGPGSAATNAGLTRVLQWGGTGLVDLRQAFQGANSLTDVPRDLPATVATLSQVFRYTTAFNDPDVSNWNTSNVTRVNSAFEGTTSFNQDLNWDLTGVSSIEDMFMNASAFDGDVSAFKNAQFTSIRRAFANADSFTGKGIDQWDVSTVKDFSGAFGSTAVFNANITNWVTDSAEIMGSMFRDAVAFNQDLNWNVTTVTNMDQMFEFSGSFDQDISDWCADLIPTKPTEFDNGAPAGFAGNAAKQPQWGGCAP